MEQVDPNFSETSAIGRQFEERGFRKVPFEDAADIYVINTCSVTDHADRMPESGERGSTTAWQPPSAF